MKVLVDTSVWVDFINGYPSPEANILSTLIRDQEIATCGVIIAEFFQGLRDSAVLREFEGYFRGMTYLAPADPETYLGAAALYRDLRRAGITIRSTIDCLIARLAAEQECYLLARDRDFKLIQSSHLCPFQPFPQP